MELLGRSILSNFKARHQDASSQIDSWEAEVKAADWRTPSDIKARYGSASILKDNHVVFNIKGNTYRLLVQVAYKTKIVLVKEVGTHQEYMNWQI
jgi:mRNA interferase HigB